MLDGYDGITGKDYKWKMIDDPKGKHKYCYEVRIFRHKSTQVKGFGDNKQWPNHLPT